MTPITKPTYKDNNGRTWHVYLREDMSVVVFYTLDNDPAHYIKYDDLDRPEDLAAENARLQKETDDVVDYYTRTVEELQAENMRLRDALERMIMIFDKEMKPGTIGFSACTKARAALAGGE